MKWSYNLVWVFIDGNGLLGICVGYSRRVAYWIDLLRCVDIELIIVFVFVVVFTIGCERKMSKFWAKLCRNFFKTKDYPKKNSLGVRMLRNVCIVRVSSLKANVDTICWNFLGVFISLYFPLSHLRLLDLFIKISIVIRCN